MIEHIKDSGLIIATIIRSGFKKDGIEFFTPNDFSQQLGYMNRPKGYKIQPHTHNRVKRDVTITNEVLYVKSGKIKIFLYGNDRSLVKENILFPGDIILLVTAGHSIEMMEDSELIEIKQGPYGDDDKINFTPRIKNEE